MYGSFVFNAVTITTIINIQKLVCYAVSWSEQTERSYLNDMILLFFLITHTKLSDN